MSDRVNYLTVALRVDTLDYDAKPLIEAVKLLKGVVAVEMNVRDPSTRTEAERARAYFKRKLWEALEL